MRAKEEKAMTTAELDEMTSDKTGGTQTDDDGKRTRGVLYGYIWPK